MTTILKEMGIQQWRLRQPHTSVVAMLDIDRTVDSENSARPVTAPPEITSPTADAISRDFETSSNVGAGDITGDLASDAALAETSRESDLKSSIKPMPAPASESVSVKNPMPTPVLAPIAMPSEAAAPFDPTAAPIDPTAAPIVATAAPIVATAAPIDPEPNRVAERPILNPMAELDWHGLQGLIDDQNQCQSCGSANSILGSGDPKADWLFVTDAPTSMDLESQQMFSGRAGQLYEAMLLAVGHNRDSVYTTSVFKCATSDTISVIPSCEKLLQRQIELIQPKVVIAFGEFAAQSVVKSNEGLESLRAQELRCYQTKVRVVVSYSPWQLLDQPSLKAGAWSDLKKCLAITH